MSNDPNGFYIQPHCMGIYNTRRLYIPFGVVRTSHGCLDTSPLFYYLPPRDFLYQDSPWLVIYSPSRPHQACNVTIQLAPSGLTHPAPSTSIVPHPHCNLIIANTRPASSSTPHPTYNIIIIQFASPDLHRPTCVLQLASTSLHHPACNT